MRELKFRAWCSYDKTMCEVESLDFGWGYVNYKSGEHDRIATPELMQYTGLRDCKRTKEYPEGQEIYEGDIVRRIATDDGKVFWDFIAVIKYNNECMAFKFERIRDIEDNIESSDLVADIITEEVLGNIHENPELLNPENHALANVSDSPTKEKGEST